MPVDVTPTKKMPSNLGSRASRALYLPRWSFVIILLFKAFSGLLLAVFGHRNNFNIMSENGEYSMGLPLSCKYENECTFRYGSNGNHALAARTMGIAYVHIAHCDG